MILGSLSCGPNPSGGASVRKQRQRHVQTTVLHILFLLVAYNGLASSQRQHHNGDILCSVLCSWKEEEQEWWCKESRACGGNGNAHKCKNGFCLFFSLSIKHRRLMQFHSQVWFTLAPIHCLRGSWRLRIFTLSNYQPLCPPTGLVNPFSTFFGSHRMHQCSSVTDFWWTRCRRAKSTLNTPLPVLGLSGPELRSPEKPSMSLWQIAAAHTEARGSV